MAKKNKIPDEYFDQEGFLVEESEASDDDPNIIGILGPKASTEQIIKYELCTSISAIIKKRKLSYPEVEKITGINASDISRIINHHLDRFTIDRLIKIHNMMDSSKNFVKFMKQLSLKLEKLSA